MKSELMNKFGRSIGKIGLKLKKHSPEILMITGVACGVASTVMACKATLKVNEVLEEPERVKQIQTINESKEKGCTPVGLTYTEEDYTKDLTIVYTQTGIKLAKLYAPAVLLGTLSITSILASNNILKKRNVALAAAYTTVDRSFKEYRSRVIERFGQKIEHELRHNLKAREIEETVINENGVEETVTKKVDVINPNQYSDYARFFDDGCTGWEKDPEYNLMFLKAQQAHANDKLKAQGYLFLNEVYDMLGIPKTKAGQVVGWIYNTKDPIGDNYVDFGIYDIYKENCRDFVNGYERTILLDFNVDGNILDLM